LTGNAEHARNDLREGRLVTLAVVVRGGAQRDAAVRFPVDERLIVRREAAGGGHLDVGGDAAAAQLAARF
jgi:hypothetical protein